LFKEGGGGVTKTDLSAVLGDREVILTPIVTELNPDNSPVVPEVKVFPATAVPLSITPVFIE